MGRGGEPSEPFDPALEPVVAVREVHEVGTGLGAVLAVPTMGMPVALLAGRRHSMLGLYP